MIHISNGLCFDKKENGNILIRKYSNAQCTSIEFEQELSPEEYRSIKELVEAVEGNPIA